MLTIKATFGFLETMETEQLTFQATFCLLLLNFSANIFIANYDINGNLLLAKHFTGSLGDVNTYGLKIDNVNNIYVSGNFLGSLYLDSDTLITGSSRSSFVFKADSLGNVIWGKETILYIFQYPFLY